MATTNDYLNQLKKDKQDLVDNLNAKGVSSFEDETFTSLVPKVLDIQGKYQEKIASAKEDSETVISPDSSYDALSKVTINKITSSAISNLIPENIKRGETILDITGTYGATSQVKSVVPSTTPQVIKPDEGIEFLSAVNISAVTKSIDPDITPENIKAGMDILGCLGTYSGDLVTQENKNVDPKVSEQIITADDGFDVMAQVTVSPVTSAIDSNIKSTNIKKGVTILSVEGSYEPEPNQEKVVTPTITEQNVTPDSGYGGLSKVTVNAVTNSIDSDIKPENIRTGIDILGVVGTLDPMVEESIIVNPTTSQQIITPSEGKTAITQVTVKPVTSAIDSNINPENIRVNKTILGVNGTYTGEDVTLQEKTAVPNTSEQVIIPDESYTALSRVTISPIETEEITIEPSLSQQVIDREGQLPLGKVTVKNVTSNIDPNIQPENIKRNMSILGVVGTYDGDPQTYFGAIQETNSPNSTGVSKAIQKLPSTLVFATDDASYAFSGLSNLSESPNVDFSSITKLFHTFQDTPLNTETNYNFQNVTSVSDGLYGTIFNAPFNFNVPSITGDLNKTFADSTIKVFPTLVMSENITSLTKTFEHSDATDLDINLNLSEIYPNLSRLNDTFAQFTCNSLKLTLGGPKVDEILIGDAVSSYYTFSLEHYAHLELIANSTVRFSKKATNDIISFDLKGHFEFDTEFFAPSASSDTFTDSEIFKSTFKRRLNSTENDVYNFTDSLYVWGFQSIYCRTRKTSSTPDGSPTEITYNCPNAITAYGLGSSYALIKKINVTTSENLREINFYIGTGAYSTSPVLEISEFEGSGIIKTSTLGLSSYTSLTTFNGIRNLGKGYVQKTENYNYYKFDLSKCISLTKESLVNIINNLYDLNLSYDVAGGGTLYTQQLVLGETNLAKLTEDEIAVATNKGWTVS